MGLIEETPVPISQYEEEFSALLDLFKFKQPMRILEIGTWQGGTLYHWIKNAPKGAKIVSIDDQHVNRDKYEDWQMNWPLNEHRVFLEYFKGDSRSSDAHQLATEHYPYDWIFIDGDHSYDGVKSDWTYYKYLANKGAIIAFHDILPHKPYNNQPVEVDKLWTEIKEYYNTKEIISNPGDGIGVVYL